MRNRSVKLPQDRAMDVIFDMAIYGGLEEAIDCLLHYMARSFARDEGPGPFHQDYLDLLSVKCYLDTL